MNQRPDVRHPERLHVEAVGFSVVVPSKFWSAVEPTSDVALVVATKESQESKFSHNHVITVEKVSQHDEGTEAALAHWQVALDLVQEQQFDGYCLIDLEMMLIAGYPGVRRLASYANDDGRSLTIQQWCTIVGERAYTLTSTVATLDFPFLVDQLDEFAQSWQIDPPKEEQA